MDSIDVITAILGALSFTLGSYILYDYYWDEEDSKKRYHTADVVKGWTVFILGGIILLGYFLKILST